MLSFLEKEQIIVFVADRRQIHVVCILESDTGDLIHEEINIRHPHPLLVPPNTTVLEFEEFFVGGAGSVELEVARVVKLVKRYIRPRDAIVGVFLHGKSDERTRRFQHGIKLDFVDDVADKEAAGRDPEEDVLQHLGTLGYEVDREIIHGDEIKLIGGGHGRDRCITDNELSGGKTPPGLRNHMLGAIKADDGVDSQIRKEFYVHTGSAADVGHADLGCGAPLLLEPFQGHLGFQRGAGQRLHKGIVDFRVKGIVAVIV